MVDFVVRHDACGTFSFASLQSDIGRSLVKQHGGDPESLETFYILSDYRTHSPSLRRKADAVLFLLQRIRGPWLMLGLFRVLPAGVLNWAYDLVARNRYRLFGRYDRCFVPDAEHRDRFLDN